MLPSCPSKSCPSRYSILTGVLRCSHRPMIWICVCQTPPRGTTRHTRRQKEVNIISKGNIRLLELIFCEDDDDHHHHNNNNEKFCGRRMPHYTDTHTKPHLLALLAHRLHFPLAEVLHVHRVLQERQESSLVSRKGEREQQQLRRRRLSSSGRCSPSGVETNWPVCSFTDDAIPRTGWAIGLQHGTQTLLLHYMTC